VLPPSPDIQFYLLTKAGNERSDFVNLQQYYLEGYLVEQGLL